MSLDRKEFEKRKARHRDGIMRNSLFPPSVRVVGFHLTDHVNFRTGYAWPPQERLAELAGVTVRTVHAACIALENDNWFRRQLSGRNWLYIPNWLRLETPEIVSGVQCRNTGNDFHEHRKFSTTNTGKKGDSILSTDNSLKENLGARCGQLDPPHAAASNDEGSGNRERVAGDWRSSLDAFRSARAKLKDAVNDGGGNGDREKIIATLPDQSAAITRQARRAGAPQFVFEGSEPWLAWTEYRKAHGIPGTLPTRQAMVSGRWRTGWDAPTLYPPGYSHGKKGGAA